MDIKIKNTPKVDDVLIGVIEQLFGVMELSLLDTFTLTFSENFIHAQGIRSDIGARIEYRAHLDSHGKLIPLDTVNMTETTRKELICKLSNKLTNREVGRLLGMSTTVVNKILRRSKGFT